MISGNQQSGSIPPSVPRSAFECLCANSSDLVFGLCYEGTDAVVTWQNAAARREFHVATGTRRAALEPILDHFQIPAHLRQAIWATLDRGDSYRSPDSATIAPIVEVLPDQASGAGCSAIVFRHRSPLTPTGRNLLQTESTQETVDLLIRALDALSAEVALLDASGRIIAVNKAWRDFARLNGFQTDDAGVGSNYLEICDTAQGAAASEAHAVASELRAVLAGRRSAAYVEYPCDSPDEQRWFQVRASGFDWEGNRYAVVSHESLTESKRAEQRHREQLDELAHQWRMSSLGELASGIAHELNQPLGAITNYMNGCMRRLEAGTIDREQLVKTARECADLAEFAAGVIKRMRSFASHTKCQYNPISFNDAITKSLQFFKASPESGKVRLDVELAIELPTVRADEVQIQQVVLNLLRNAADAVVSCGCKPGRVDMRTFEDADGMVCVSVADNGHGLPDGAEGRLFEPFYSTKSKGMGLGLSISKTIAEVHGGRLSARNASTGGAVFELRLPPLKRAASLGKHAAGCNGRTDARSGTSTPAHTQGGAP